MCPASNLPANFSELSPRVVLHRLYEAALDAARPGPGLGPYLDSISSGRVVVVGAGKAAAAMAQTVERHMPLDMTGLVIVPDRYAVCCERIEVVEASHPLPDARGARATERIMRLARAATEGDTVLCLLSGGASALLTAPIAGIQLSEKRDIVSALLKEGASIDEINCVRKHLSAVKGGRLANIAAPARILTLIVSDVVGDDSAVIASGPTVPDPSTCNDALAVFRRHGIAVSKHLEKLLAIGTAETPKILDVDTAAHIVIRPADALAAAAAAAIRYGLNIHNLGDRCSGSARLGAAKHAAIVQAIAEGRGPVRAPCVILSGGEYTVQVRGSGRGGPNTEFALALAVKLDGAAGVWAIAADTDGIDGSANAAGAVVAPDTLARAGQAGRNATQDLANNDSAGLFGALQDLIAPGPTCTNVSDFRAILVTTSDR